MRDNLLNFHKLHNDHCTFPPAPDAPDCVYYKGDTHRTKWEVSHVYATYCIQESLGIQEATIACM